jgi:hypothetical protein
MGVDDVEFLHENHAVDDGEHVRSLNKYGDNIVVFTAHVQDRPRRPLEPSNSQAFATPRSFTDVKPIIKNEPSATPFQSASLHSPNPSMASRASFPTPQATIMKHEPRRYHSMSLV